jgi:uncharacterized protein (DUF305 family)
MMALHHQGAIGMAKTELRYGKSERLDRAAQEFVGSDRAVAADPRRSNDWPARSYAHVA